MRYLIPLLLAPMMLLGCEEPYQSGGTGSGTGSPPPRQPTNLTQQTGAVVGAQAYEVKATDELPVPFDRNSARGLSIGSGVKEGKAEIPSSAANPSSNAVTTVQPPDGKSAVRIEIDKDQAKSTLGAARTLAAGLTAMILETDNGKQYTPAGYVWVRSDMSQEIKIETILGTQRGIEIPVREMPDGDRMYLFFFVDPGSTLKSFTFGNAKQMISGVTAN